MAEAMVLGLLGAWFGVTVLNQLGRRPLAAPRWMRAVSALPNWRLFAPNPVVSDHELLYRDRLADGTVTPVRHLALRQRRRPWHLLWNPRNRTAKVLTDCLKAFHELHRHDPDLDLRATIPYAIVARHVLRQPPVGPVGTHRQFVVARAEGLGARRLVAVVLTSEYHRLP